MEIISFAALWKKKLGGRVWAYVGQSSYYNIMFYEGYDKYEAYLDVNSYAARFKEYVNYARNKDGYGFCRVGSFALPKAGDGAYRKEF